MIDHLWHLTETGYYIRQGGPYPPFTWKIASIVKHHHQEGRLLRHPLISTATPIRPSTATGCTWATSTATASTSTGWQRDGSTYQGEAEPDFLTANDAWFMPVVQKTGPDGCLYILDWYDRYHCYQDAASRSRGNRSAQGPALSRALSRTRRGPRKFDLARESDEQLIARLASPNVYFRDMAQRLLVERDTNQANRQAKRETRSKLEQLVLDDSATRKARMHALWALVGTGSLSVSFHQQLLAHAEPGIPSLGRASGRQLS